MIEILIVKNEIRALGSSIIDKKTTDTCFILHILGYLVFAFATNICLETELKTKKKIEYINMFLNILFN